MRRAGRDTQAFSMGGSMTRFLLPALAAALLAATFAAGPASAATKIGIIAF